MEKRSFKFLWKIPGVMVLDLLVLTLAGYLDSEVLFKHSEDVTGHGFPVFTLIAVAVMGILTTLVFLSCIFKIFAPQKTNHQNRLR